MFISIITPTFNSEKLIKICLSSVKDQNFQNYEHIIIDNSSNDKTLKIIKEFNNPKIKLISENDNGIYDAMNKGINASSGEYLLFLNSDDKLIDRNFLSNVNKILLSKKIDILYSNIIYEKNFFGITRKYITGNLDKIHKFGNHIPHPGSLISKKFMHSIGNFDVNLKISADFDFFIKAKKNKEVIYYYYDKFTVLMSHGGASSGIKNIFEANIECYKSLKKNNEKFPLFFIIVKLLRKFLQFL